MIGFQYRVTIITYARFGSFFRYSLGDFTRVETERFNNVFGHGVRWVFEYQRANGESDRITLRTVGLSHELTEGNFANQFMDHATQMVMDDLLRENVQEHFTLVEEERNPLAGVGHGKFYIADYEYIYLVINIMRGERGNGSNLDEEQARRVLDRRDGIQLYSLTPYTFFNEWENELGIWIRSYHRAALSENQLLERFKSLVRDVSQSHHIPVVKINFWHGEEAFTGYYCLETDTFETRLWSDIRAEQEALREAERQAEFEEFERQVMELRERFGGDIGEMHVDVSFLETLTPEQVVLAEEFIFHFVQLDEFGPPKYGIHFTEGTREVEENLVLFEGGSITYNHRTRWRTDIWRNEAGDIVNRDDDEAYHFDHHRMEIQILVFCEDDVVIREFFRLEGRKDREEEFVFYRQVENENSTAAIIYDFHHSEFVDMKTTIVVIRAGRVMIYLYESHRTRNEWGEMSVAFLELFYEFLQESP